MTPTPSGGDTVKPKATGIVTLSLEPMAGNVPLQLGETAISQAGVQYQVLSLKFFVAQPWLVTDKGDTVWPQILDSASKPTNYNLLLVDYNATPMPKLHLLAKPATYTSLGFMIGVPVVGNDGDSLNHGDASVRKAPLDVDNGMYWSWNPGYIFLRIEGRSFIDTAWQPFFYHVGNDERLMHIQLTGLSLPVDTTDMSTGSLVVNVNRLFVDIFGHNVPNIAGSSSDRIANGGEMTTLVSRNAAMSGFINIKK